MKSTSCWINQDDIGNQTIEKQHQMLSDLVCRIESLENLHNGQDKERFHSLLNDLFELTGAHFDTEEQFLAKSKYSHLAHHQKEHSEIMEELSEILMESMKGEFDLKRLSNMVSLWWQHHESEGNIAQA